MNSSRIFSYFLFFILFFISIISLSVGRFAIPFGNTIGILIHQFFPIPEFWTQTQANIIFNLRLPRLLLGLLVGAGLASSGSAFQGIFINPLVSPFILGVAAGAGFGGVLALLIFGSGLWVFVWAFVAGMIAMSLTFAINHNQHHSSTLRLVLTGIITSALFTAAISLVKIVADPIDQLPSIVYWLMGSLSSATYSNVLLASFPILIGIVGLYLLRFRINLLSLGDESAASLSINTTANRWLIIILVTMIVSATVAVAGIIGWIGLVIPHLARMLVGANHQVSLPTAALLGSMYLIFIDTLARSLTPAEIPIGIMTAIIGSVIFAIVIRFKQHTGFV